jgi:hypothetical protein
MIDISNFLSIPTFFEMQPSLFLCAEVDQQFPLDTVEAAKKILEPKQQVAIFHLFPGMSPIMKLTTIIHSTDPFFSFTKVLIMDSQ